MFLLATIVDVVGAGTHRSPFSGGSRVIAVSRRQSVPLDGHSIDGPQATRSGMGRIFYQRGGTYPPCTCMFHFKVPG